MIKLLSPLYCALLLSCTGALALNESKALKKESDPVATVNFKSDVDLFIGGGSTGKDTTASSGFGRNFGFSVVFSKKFLNDSEFGINTSFNLESSKPKFVYWKFGDTLEIQLFAPKSAVNNMFFSSKGFLSENEENFAKINKTDAIYTKGHKFFVDGICKSDAPDPKFLSAISKKVAFYLNAGEAENNLKLGVSFTPSSSDEETVLKSNSGGLSKAQLIETRNKFFESKNVVSLAQSYNHKSSNKVSLKLTAVQEFGSLKSLDLERVIKGNDNFKKIKYRPFSKDKSTTVKNFSRREDNFYALGLAGEVKIDRTSIRAAASHTTNEVDLNTFALSCGIEHKFEHGFKAAVSYFQSHDRQNSRLFDTASSIYRSIGIHGEKELSEEISLYVGWSHARGYHNTDTDIVKHQGSGICFGTKITI